MTEKTFCKTTTVTGSDCSWVLKNDPEQGDVFNSRSYYREWQKELPDLGGHSFGWGALTVVGSA
jgi:hypothetical protein